jgi:hypothetical protein
MDTSKFVDDLMAPTMLPVMTHLGRFDGVNVFHYTARNAETHTLKISAPQNEIHDALRVRIQEIEYVGTRTEN